MSIYKINTMLSYYNFSLRRKTEILLKEKKILINSLIAGLGKKINADKKELFHINIKFLEYGTLKVILKKGINSQTRKIAGALGTKILDLNRVGFRKILLITLKDSDHKLFYKGCI